MSVRPGPGSEELALGVCDASQIRDVKQVTIGEKLRCR